MRLSAPFVRSAPRRQSGFTLLELVVALFIFSVAAMALLNLAGENVRAAQALERRAFAQLVAENVAVDSALAPLADEAGVRFGEEVLAGRTWRWERRTNPTEDPSMVRIEIIVREGDQPQALAFLSIFREP